MRYHVLMTHVRKSVEPATPFARLVYLAPLGGYGVIVGLLQDTESFYAHISPSRV
jgi:hypothetical protein